MVSVSNLYTLEIHLSALLLYYLPFICSNSSEHEQIVLRTLAATDEKEETGLDRDNIDLDKDINNVCDKLRTLDVTLTKMNKDPPVAGGEEIMRMLRTYNQACRDLLFLTTKDKLKVLNAAEDILEPGGPKFLDAGINEKKMEERFQWDEDKMDEMWDVRKKTYEHWNDLWYINNNFP